MRTKGTISIDTIAKLVSAKCNYTDPAGIKQFYYGLLRVIMDGLRNNGRIHLENLGEFSITTIKDRKIGALRTKEVVRVPECKIVKFRPCEKLKYYVKNKM